ncbi:type I pullulanase [Facklamia miroungae]|uniref:Pullulanase n=1 Tax=Facklamia miroungae TaxID=120956 RepID=A0A1G7QMC6_9LACT|nr:type I pullulanase [Facklamia miroungae]NKZ28993.1 type I pullulanase [Facklamia miroungae]SDF99656.1 pullulanase [Facklamia miroungae]
MYTEERLKELDQMAYLGSLGAIYVPEKTLFKIWAPTARTIHLIVFDGYYGRVKETLPMENQEGEALFQLELLGDQHGTTYRYRIFFNDGSTTETIDPYAKACTVNGRRSVVVDLARTNPEQWSKRMPAFPDDEAMIIYEVNIRDLTIHPDSGVSYKGGYLGLSQANTQNQEGYATGLDYLSELGVTHLEFLPFFDFDSIDETFEQPNEYNWGYDPYNYNIPEGSYATDPYDPVTRIKELKQMIHALHQRGIRVIMDVVYNHVYQVENHPFQLTVPHYYFRYDQSGQLTNGSGVGNDTASERIMMQQYMIDSVVYWANEFHIDGFRFDLMGLHDQSTMQKIRQALDQIDPSIFILGEGWDMSSPIPADEKANLNNAFKMPRIAQFNDGIREAIKGNDFNPEARGFINGAWYMEEPLVNNFLARYDSEKFNNPKQVIQYCEAHDNYTLYDRLMMADPYHLPEIIIKKQELGLALVILAQGIPFIHAGQEFLRSKQGVRDSYNRPDSINQIDWSLMTQHRKTVEYVKGLIQLRKEEPLLRQTSYQALHCSTEVIQASDQIMAVRYAGEKYDLILMFNGGEEYAHFNVPLGNYTMLVYNGIVDNEEKEYLNQVKSINLLPYSTTVIKRLKK